ncbi:MAG: DUF1648 domain-containing protein [Chloroflexi bacterium]|nr:DUF1648 domain-containing protein [Chloroflexota bacterium]
MLWPVMWQRLGKSYSPQFELVPLALLFLAFYLAITAYPSLPDRIPSHFNLGGLPDQWGGKAGIYTFPVVGTAVYLMVTAITVAFSIAKDPKSLMNLPRKAKDAITPAQAEELRTFVTRSMMVLKCLVLGMSAYGTYGTIQVATGKAASLGTEFNLFFAGIMLVVAYMLWRTLRLMFSAGKQPRP